MSIVHHVDHSHSFHCPGLRDLFECYTYQARKNSDYEMCCQDLSVDIKVNVFNIVPNLTVSPQSYNFHIYKCL